MHDQSNRCQSHVGIACIPEVGHSGDWLDLLVEFSGRLDTADSVMLGLL